MDNLVTVKAYQDDAGEWVLDVLGVPFGGPFKGKDKHGEYFDSSTLLHEDKYGLPPAVYYHGYGEDGKPAGSPAYIGRTVSREKRADGWLFGVILDKKVSLARKVFEAAQKGEARASSGSAPHMVRVAPDGKILEWPVMELSLFDTTPTRQPANPYAIVNLASLKAIYNEAGLSYSEELDASEPQDGAIGESESAVTAKSEQGLTPLQAMQLRLRAWLLLDED